MPEEIQQQQPPLLPEDPDEAPEEVWEFDTSPVAVGWPAQAHARVAELEGDLSASLTLLTSMATERDLSNQLRDTANSLSQRAATENDEARGVILRQKTQIATLREQNLELGNRLSEVMAGKIAGMKENAMLRAQNLELLRDQASTCRRAAQVLGEAELKAQAREGARRRSEPEPEPQLDCVAIPATTQ
jgi:hypothetical protein